MRQVEKDFWYKRFKVYAQWKKDWYADYLELGYFDTLTGFRCSGVMDRKQAVNYPIQGSAFHCLLWCLIRIRKLLHKYHLKTKLIGQIHDSLLSDIYKGELKDYYEIVHKVMTEDLVRHWKSWIIVPMDVEFEVAPVGHSWKDKQKFILN
jgi:DNA polymerase I-like protein with 3'-5' exonuclease and polymerase domains